MVPPGGDLRRPSGAWPRLRWQAIAQGMPCGTKSTTHEPISNNTVTHMLGLTFLIILGVAGPLGFVLSSPVLIVPIIVIPMSVADKYKRVYQNFSNQLNLQQRALLDEAANEEYAQYYWRQQQQQQIQNMFNNINRQY